MEARHNEIVLLIQLGIPLLLLFVAWMTQRHVTRSRRKYLERWEEHFRERVLLTNMRRFPAKRCSRPVLVTGTAVIANNYFVSFASVFKHLFGGELKGYAAMCADARRLAIVRMLQEAEAAGANAVFNVRFETANVLTANSQKQSGGVELIVYGTAMRLDA